MAGKPIPDFNNVIPEADVELANGSTLEENEELEQCEIDRPFYPYQQKVYDWAKDKDRVGFFLEMRLGKTMITIRWLKRKIKKNLAIKRILIVCPKTVVPVWERELVKEGLFGVRINSTATRQLEMLVSTMPGWYITNYEAITATNLEQMKWDAVILDEGNKIKDPNTKITRKLTNTYPSLEEKKEWTEKQKADYKNLIETVPIKADLTGTPAPETLLDYYNQVKFLGVHLFDAPSWWVFRDRFFQAVGPNKYAPWPYLKEALAGEISKFAYVLKRDQVDMGSLKVYEQKFVDFDDAKYAKEYRDMEMMWANTMLETEWAIVSFNYLQQLSGGFPKPKGGDVLLRSEHKINELEKICFEDDLKADAIVIWCRFVEEIHAILKRFNTLDPGCCRGIYGETIGDARLKNIDDFMSKDYRLLVGQIKTASMGIDLSVADTAIYYSNSFSATDRLQSEDRIIHPEKKSPVLYLDLITQGTIDFDVVEALKHKTEGQDSFMRRVHDLAKERHG